MPSYCYLILVVGWITWGAPFFLIKRSAVKTKEVDRRARWGILLEGIAYSLIWQGRFWLRSPNPGRVSISVCFLAMASLLSWSGSRALGRQWRIDAGLNEDHDLVTSGPYRFIRHPI